MPTVVKKDSGNLEATLDITIHYSDYQKGLNEEIQKFQQKAQIKGFRKGKTPPGLVTKMYGRGILVEVINRLVQDSLFDYLKDENILGQPLPSESQISYEFDPKSNQDYVFSFDIGLSPQFEVAGLDKSSVFAVPVPEITPEMVEEEVRHLREEHAKTAPTNPPYKDKDLLTFNARELESPGVLKPEGHSSKFSLLFQDATEEAAKMLANLEVGQTVELDIFSLENGRDEDFVRRYILLIPQDNPIETGRLFQLELESASGKIPRELNTEFFDELFGTGTIEDETAFRTFVRDEIANAYKGSSNFLFFQEIQKFLTENNPLQLPDQFLKRWIRETNKDRDAAEIERDYPTFAKNLQWSLIRNKIANNHQVQVSEQELQDYFLRQIAGYFRQVPGIGMDFYQNMVRRMMENEQQVEKAAEEILTGKIVQIIRNEVTINENPVELAAFNALVETARSSLAAATQSGETAEEEEQQ